MYGYPSLQMMSQMAGMGTLGIFHFSKINRLKKGLITVQYCRSIVDGRNIADSPCRRNFASSANAKIWVSFTNKLINLS